MTQPSCRPTRARVDLLEPRRLLTASLRYMPPTPAHEPQLTLASGAGGTIYREGVDIAVGATFAESAVVLGAIDGGTDGPQAVLTPRKITFGASAFGDDAGTPFYEDMGGPSFGTALYLALADTAGIGTGVGQIFVSSLTLDESASRQTADGGFALVYSFSLSTHGGRAGFDPDAAYLTPVGIASSFDLVMKWDAGSVAPRLAGADGAGEVGLATTVLPAGSACSWARVAPHGSTAAFTSWQFQGGTGSYAAPDSLVSLNRSFTGVAAGIVDPAESEADGAVFVGDAGTVGYLVGLAGFDPSRRTADLAAAKRQFLADTAAATSNNGVSINLWALVPPAGAPPASHARLEVKGAITLIRDGQTFVADDLGTDFGTAAVGSARSRSFELDNVGTASLAFASNAIDISGPGKASFAVTRKPAASLGADGGTTRFMIRFLPKSAGLQSATVTIHSNAVDHEDYSFTIEGAGAGATVPTRFAKLNLGRLYITGTAGNDDLRVSHVGSSLAVFLNGATLSFPFASVDALDVGGGAGNDRIDLTAADVAASVTAGDGDDRVVGGALADSIDGGAGRDTIHGGAGGDQINGFRGRDKLYGDDGPDRIFGGRDGDWLYGGDGADELYGENGADRLDGGAGVDRLDGGWADDTLVAEPGVAEHLFGGRDADSVEGDASLDVLWSVERGA